MARKGGLGRGLEALIPGSYTTDQPSGGPLLVPLHNIQPNPRQPRSEIKDNDLQELAASIQEHGILQPLIVTRAGESDQYILIAGERRLRAAELIGLESVPVIIRQASDQQRLELALIENIQRENLSALESAAAYQQLADEFDLTHEEIAVQVSKSRTAVTNTIRLLKLPESVRKALEEEAISEGHARALLALESAPAQAAALQTILKNQLNVRQTEDLVRRLGGAKPKTAPKTRKSSEIRDLEERLRSRLGTRVSVQHGKGGGTITIHYYSDEELDALIEALLHD